MKMALLKIRLFVGSGRGGDDRRRLAVGRRPRQDPEQLHTRLVYSTDTCVRVRCSGYGQWPYAAVCQPGRSRGPCMWCGRRVRRSARRRRRLWRTAHMDSVRSWPVIPSASRRATGPGQLYHIYRRPHVLLAHRYVYRLGNTCFS